MRLFLLLTLLPILAVVVSGCASKSPADSNPPPGVMQNPNPPNPQAIRSRKQMMIDPQKGSVPSGANGQR